MQTWPGLSGWRGMEIDGGLEEAAGSNRLNRGRVRPVGMKEKQADSREIRGGKCGDHPR